MSLRKRYVVSPELISPNTNGDETPSEEDITEWTRAVATKDREVEAVPGEADDSSRASATASIVSAVADNVGKKESSPSNSTSIVEREDANAAPAPSPIPSK